MKKLTLFYLFVLSYGFCFSQKALSAACNYLWTEERPIVVEISPSKPINTSHPSVLNLNLSFNDFDKKSAIKSDSCTSAGLIWAESETARYKLKIKTLDGIHLTFNPNVNIDTLEQIFDFTHPSQILDIPIGNGNIMKYNLYQFYFPVFTKPQWQVDKKKLTIYYTIIDLSTLPTKDSGNLIDKNATGKWEIIYKDDVPCPDSTISLSTNPSSSVWTIIPSNNAIDFDYAVGPDLKKDKKADYTGKNITEVLSGPFAGDLFTMADLDNSWKVSHINLNTPDKVADFLAKSFIPSPHMWTIINSPVHQDKFSGFDSHGSFYFQNFQDAFTETAIMEGKAGFMIKQDYMCNGTKKIGSTEIYKRYKPVISGKTVIQNRELKKVHKF
jgi:hypothetical protein